eukprot:gene13252-13382_t
MQRMIAPGSGVMRISRLQQAHHDASTRCVAPTALSCRGRPQQELPSVALSYMSSSNNRRPLAVLKAPAFKALNSVFGGIDPRVRGLVLLNIMTLLMGSNWVVIKSSNSAFDPVVFTSLRFTLAAAAFAPFLKQGLTNPDVRKAGIEIGAWTALGYLCQSWALSMTPASRASLLSTFTVVAVPCLAGLSGQKLFRTEQMSRQLPQGNAVSLMAVIISTVAAASLTSAAVVHGQDAAAAAGSLWNVIMSGVHALLPGDSGADSAEPLFELLYTSFCSTDLVLMIELMALQTVSSTEAALIYSMEPVSGALMFGGALEAETSGGAATAAADGSERRNT